MNRPSRVPPAIAVVAGLMAGGAVGAGVRLGFYRPAVAVVAAVIVGFAVGLSVRRSRLAARRKSGNGR